MPIMPASLQRVRYSTLKDIGCKNGTSPSALLAEGASVYRAHLWRRIDVHKIKTLFEGREPNVPVFVAAYTDSVADLPDHGRLLAYQPNRFVVIFQLRRIHLFFVTNVKMKNSGTGVIAIQSILTLLFGR